jgi:hypothetical protein
LAPLRFDPVAMALDQTANPGPGVGSPGGDSKGEEPLGDQWKKFPLLVR